MLAKLLFVISFIFFNVHLFSQVPYNRSDVKNYKKQQYNAGSQNWKIRQGNKGKIFFANNEGLLVYDGTYWNLYPLPNKTILRSFDFGWDKKLYAGGQDEFGYYAPDKYGKLIYVSLKDLLLKQDKSFEDVWNVVSTENNIFFQTNYKIFKYNGKNISIYPAFFRWLFIGMHYNRLLALDDKTGLLEYKDDGSWQTFIEKRYLPEGFFITGIAPLGKDSSIISTAKNGFFILAGNHLSAFPLKGYNIDDKQNFTGVEVSENQIITCSYTTGLYIVNKNGTITEHFGKEEGLQNTNVRSLFLDKNRNIWLGLDNGIDYIINNNAIRHINPPQFNDGIGYSMAMNNEDIYFGLSNGVYQLKKGIALLNNQRLENNFKNIAGGQTWRLASMDGYLFVGKDDGFYQIKNDKLLPVSKVTGFWTFKSIPGMPKPTIATGNYQGIRFFEETPSGLLDKGVAKNFIESSRYLVVENNQLWISHPYRGVYKINFKDSSVKLYTSQNGLPSTLDNHVFSIKNKTVVGTEKGIYQYDFKKDKFIKSTIYTPFFGDLSIRYLQEDPAGNIWFVHEKNVGVLDFSNKKPVIINIPELSNKILSGFENIYTPDSTNAFVSAENGFYHIDYLKYKKNIHPFNVYIHAVRAVSKFDSTIYDGYNALKDAEQTTPQATLSYRWNALHFEYSAPLYSQQENVEYSYYLHGFEKEWSPWTKKTEKDYTNLPPGNYTFYVKARTHTINETKPAIFPFSISPPWYQTTWAFIIYAMVAAWLMYVLYKWQERKHHKKQESKLAMERARHEEDQKNLQYQHEIELEKAEKEVMRLQKENLETKIEQKNSELASITMNLVQKKEFVLKLKEQLSHLNKSVKDNEEKTEIKKLLRILSDEERLDEEWEQFSIHFNNVHGDFLNILKEKYPDLKPHELKLCTYLRMNLSSKEIAQLMSISVRGVEISRYRLRKKLKVSTEVNLFQFLFDLQKAGK